ncbi:MAG: TerB family tellurite resistance protein [Parafilimonas sp.]
MFQDYITTQNEAICHLFLHCCFKDGTFSKDEIDNVSEKFVTLQIHRDLNFKEELLHYKEYKSGITDEDAYLQYLLKLIHPVQNLALYSYCIELSLSDKIVSAEEGSLLTKIAALLEVSEEKNIIDKLFAQRKAVELEKIF